MIRSSLGCVTNYLGREVARPASIGMILGVCAGAVAYAFLAAGRRLAPGYALAQVGLAGGMGLAGLIDDVAGSRSSSGFAGHLKMLLQGQLTTGVLKIAFAAVVCVACAMAVGHGGAWALVDGVLLASAANVVNLLDTRPGRAIKGSLLILALMGSAGANLQLASPIAGASLAFLKYDLSEQGMLGDTGANPLGALVVLSALQMSRGWRIIALLVLAAVNLIAERASLGRLIESCPPLAAIDRLGRRTD